MKKLLVFLSFVVFFSCQKKELHILISKDYENMIHNWLQQADENIITHEFYSLPIDSLEHYLNKADGMVLGGGEDVNPKLYDKPDYDSLCEDYDNYRDSIEVLMIQFAMDNKIPIFGICRGQQLLNVVNGGTLIPDIPTFKTKSLLNHRIKTTYAHRVIAVSDSWLANSFYVDTFDVNSRHHQAVDKLAPGFVVAAFAPDSVIESIILADSLRHPFAAAVQWHPEGLTDTLSFNIARYFINQVKESKN